MGLQLYMGELLAAGTSLANHADCCCGTLCCQFTPCEGEDPPPVLFLCDNGVSLTEGDIVQIGEACYIYDGVVACEGGEGQADVGGTYETCEECDPCRCDTECPDNKKPIARFSALLTSDSESPPCCFQFSDRSTVAQYWIDNDCEREIVEWLWDFGDETGSSAQNPEHCYEEDDYGPWTVTLQVTDDCGCQDTYEAIVYCEDTEVCGCIGKLECGEWEDCDGQKQWTDLDPYAYDCPFQPGVEYDSLTIFWYWTGDNRFNLVVTFDDGSSASAERWVPAEEHLSCDDVMPWTSTDSLLASVKRFDPSNVVLTAEFGIEGGISGYYVTIEGLEEYDEFGPTGCTYDLDVINGQTWFVPCGVWTDP